MLAYDGYTLSNKDAKRIDRRLVQVIPTRYINSLDDTTIIKDLSWFQSSKSLLMLFFS